MDSRQIYELIFTLIKYAFFLYNQEKTESSEYKRIAEILSFMVDCLPETKRYLTPNLILYYYEDALPVTMKDIQKNFTKFLEKNNDKIDNCIKNNNLENIIKIFVNWVRIILKSDCLDVYRYKKNQISISEFKDSNLIYDSYNAHFIVPLEQISTSFSLDEFLTEDIKNHLKNLTLRKNPNCNCLMLLERRFLNNPPDKWDDIALEYQVSPSTIKMHWKRKCQPFLETKIKKIIDLDNLENYLSL